MHEGHFTNTTQAVILYNSLEGLKFSLAELTPNGVIVVILDFFFFLHFFFFFYKKPYKGLKNGVVGSSVTAW